jgi:hypothetical protein
MAAETAEEERLKGRIQFHSGKPARTNPELNCFISKQTPEVPSILPTMQACGDIQAGDGLASPQT